MLASVDWSDSMGVQAVHAGCSFHQVHLYLKELIQSTLIISNSKGLSEILWDIRTSTYQICRIEEKIIQTTTFNMYVYM